MIKLFFIKNKTCLHDKKYLNTYYFLIKNFVPL